ncbi:MAG: hypothetical protein ABI678_16375 [Kofleriaceae bacterium]
MRPWICVALLAGCGDDPHATTDASNHGETPKAIDAPGVNGVACTPSSATGPVTVDGPTSSGTLEVTFVVHDPDGTVVSRSATMGSDATVSLTVPACGMVSIIRTDASRTEVLTFTAVQPGDHLVHTGRSMPAIERAVDVTVPVQTGATGYQLIAVCSATHLEITSTQNPGVVHMTPSCTGASVSVIATAQTSAKPIALATVALAASGTTTMTLPAFAPPVVSTLHAHALGAYTTGLYATFAKPSGNLLLLGDTMGNVSGGSLTLTSPIVAGEAGIEVELDGPGPGTTKQHTLLVRGVATIPASVDLTAADLLPPVTASIDTAPRPTVTWDSTAHAAVALFEIHAGDASWNLVAPPVPGAIRYPELPGDLWPGGAPVLTGAGVLESTAVTSYNANNLALIMEDFPAVGTQIRETFIDMPSSSSFARRAWHRR